MKNPTPILVVSIILACSPSIATAKGSSSPGEKEPSVAKTATGQTAPSNQVTAPRAELSEKEMLAAINAKLERLEQRITNLEIEQRSQLAGLREGVQQAFTQVGDEIGSIQNSITLLKKAAKAATPSAVEKPNQP
jgi:uncharacterized coiled-coil protein SlyX